VSKNKHSHIIEGKRQWNNNALDFFSVQLKDIINNKPSFDDSVFLDAAKNIINFLYDALEESGFKVVGGLSKTDISYCISTWGMKISYIIKDDKLWLILNENNHNITDVIYGIWETIRNDWKNHAYRN
tara:strand:- start:1829 stop:2212 length:384 start_codon:yes stop_codon:yes gene_type:complete